MNLHEPHHDPEYRVVFEHIYELDDGSLVVELYDEHNDLLGWHRADLRAFGEARIGGNNGGVPGPVPGSRADE